MEFSIQTNKLKDVLSLASRFCLSKLSSIPSLQGGLLCIGTRELEVITTNLNDFFYTRIPIKREGKEEVGVVDIKKIVEFLNFVHEEKVTIRIDEHKLFIKTGKTEGSFTFLSSQDFPQVPKVEGVKTVLKNAFLKKKLPFVLFSAAKDETRPILTGIHFSQKNNDNFIVSTDGFRLSLVSEKKEKTELTMTLSALVLGEIVRLVEEEDVDMFFSETEKIVRFVCGDKEIYTRLIEGEFPAFERVLPSQFKTRIVVDREEFERNIKLASVFARDTSSTIIFEIVKKTLRIRPRAAQGDSVVVDQDVEEIEGEDKKIAFNYRFVVDFLNNTSSKKIIFEATESTSPGVFKLDNNEDFTHIIMPIRIEEDTTS